MHECCPSANNLYMGSIEEERLPFRNVAEVWLSFVCVDKPALTRNL